MVVSFYGHLNADHRQQQKQQKHWPPVTSHRVSRPIVLLNTTTGTHSRPTQKQKQSHGRDGAVGGA